MKCLTDEQIQLYIDGEISKQELTKIDLHLSECSICRPKLEQQQLFIRELKATLRPSNDIAAPPFALPKETHGKRRAIPIWLKVAAVLVPLLLIWELGPYGSASVLKPTNQKSSIINLKTSVIIDNNEEFSYVKTDVVYSEN